MKTIFVAATQMEVQPLLDYFKWEKIYDDYYSFEEHGIFITGAGVFPLTYKLSRFFQTWDHHNTRMILVGIAGVYSNKLAPGDLCQVVEECFADTGAEEINGQILTMEDLNLWPNASNNQIAAVFSFPLKPIHLELPSVRSITVNTASGNENTIGKRVNQFDPDIENMEGAAFFQICTVNGFSSTQIRAISNYVTPRNKSAWKIRLAIEKLNTYLIQSMSSKLF